MEQFSIPKEYQDRIISAIANYSVINGELFDNVPIDEVLGQILFNELFKNESDILLVDEEDFEDEDDIPDDMVFPQVLVAPHVLEQLGRLALDCADFIAIALEARSQSNKK